jgi:DNA-binding transcriptional LysR family regulator
MGDDGSFRVGFVPGVTLTKWSRVWEERHPRDPLHIFHVDPSDPLVALREARADVVFVRLPIDRAGMNVIPLYDEQPVVVVAKEHALADFETCVLADLDGEARLDLDPALDLVSVVEVVETGAGIAVLPQSLARLYGRKGVTTRVVTDAEPTTIALVWPEDATTDDVSDFIGVVRGRTANSSRDRPAADTASSSKAGNTKPGTAKSTPAPSRSRGRGPQRGRTRGGPRRRG